MTTLVVDVRFLAVLVECDCCGQTARMTKTEQVEDWFCCHLGPRIASVDLMVNGRFTRRAWRPSAG